MLLNALSVVYRIQIHNISYLKIHILWIIMSLVKILMLAKGTKLYQNLLASFY